MAITLKTHKMLWGRSGNHCSICRQELVLDPTETDDESLIGEECHIVAEKKDGPRGESDLDELKRDKYDNLILLCRNHHKMIDDQVIEYSVDKLNEIKATHIEWVRSSLSGYDSSKQRTDEYYAGIIDEFSTSVKLDNWRNWSSFVLGAGQPRLSKDVEKSLQITRDWILSRVWPHMYPEIEEALTNFRLVLQDFLNTFHEHSEEAPDMFYTRKFYNIREWDTEKYERLAEKYDFHCHLVEDLMLELTRAANYVCDMVRKSLFPTFRLKEGVILVERGPFMNLMFRIYRPEYHGGERTSRPYPGLKEFKTIRQNRDVHIGYGSDPNEEQEYERKAQQQHPADTE